MLKAGNATVDTAVVREFLYTIAAQARVALADLDKPGLLQLSRLHPSSETIVPSRFVLADVELMVAAAITDCEAGHNVYLEGRTVREGLRGNERGKLSDTVAVFALVVDSDADKGMGWNPTVRPSLIVETSPDNFQYWFFLREAISPELAQRLGELIRRAVNSDHDTGNPTQPYRVAGTPNYPNAKKAARGRITVPTRLVEFDPEVLWTPEDIEQAFPLPQRAQSEEDGTAGETDESDISEDTMRVICDGVVSDRDRSHAFWNVIVALNVVAPERPDTVRVLRELR
jgi:RepB DNA-primase from phage plasmid